MRMTAKDGSLDLFGEDYRRGSSRKPPRPQARRRRCVSEDVRRSRSEGRLTSFQKLDREMGRFVKAQQNDKTKQQQQQESSSGLMMQGSEEESGSVRGVRHGVKWKCGWMFEQDSLYWETVRRQDVSADDHSRRCAQAREGARCDSNSSAAECEDALRHHCSTDHESVSSGMELHLRQSHTNPRRNRSRGPKQEADDENGAEEGERRRSHKGWPAVLRAKCEVLQMEKELADQRLQQHTADMAQAAEMAHCLRQSVQTILETAKRGTVSAPCTPGRSLQEDYSPCLQQRIQRLHTVAVQRDLEDQAKSFQNRIDTLRLQSQIRSGDSSVRNDSLLKTTRVSSTSSTTQVLTSDGEDWAQVQEVLQQLRGKTGSLQYNCESWEKRAIFAESKAASLQIEEEKWRVDAQKAAEKVRELERELVQIRATLEEVRNRHALEQSRLLGSGSNHGYTLVLQPIVTSTTDCESCSHCHSSTNSGNQQPATLSHIDHPSEDAATLQNFDESYDEPGSEQAVSSAQLHNPDREPSEATTTSGQASRRHRYDGALEDEDSPPPIKTGQISTIPGTAKTETERSISQKWFKQRPKSRRPGTPSCDSNSSDTRSNLGNSPIPSKTLQHRKGLAAAAGIQKPGPVYAGSMRVSSPSPLEKRAPLREIKRNAANAVLSDNANKSDCSR